MKKKYYFLLIFFIASKLIYSQSSNYNTNKFQYLSPVPGSSLHLPQTNIIIRQGEELVGVDLNDTTLITVIGNSSGKHSGQLFITNDSKTLIFQPNQPFTNGENVTVKLKYGINKNSDGNVDSLGFNFYITTGCDSPTNSITSYLNNFNNNYLIHKNNFSKTNLNSSINLPEDFPTVSINNKTTPEDGYYFVGINQATTNYISILSNNGIPIFYKKFADKIYDFKLQSNGLLTYFDGSFGKYYGIDSLYQLVDSFYTGNGYFTDFHDLQVLSNGHSFVISYDSQPVNMDTVVAGGNTSACVVGCVIQELDTNKRVIWQWRSWDHFKITDADPDIDLFQIQTVIQYCHINSFDIPNDSTIIFSVKHFNEITSVNRQTGNINWRLGGENNQYIINGDPVEFKLQHDARYFGNKLTLFDNGKVARTSSRGVIYNIDEQTKTVSLLKEFYHIPNVWTKVMGNFQLTKNGNYVAGWGHTGSTKNYITEYDSKGNLTNDVIFTNDNFIFSYRAFKFPWKQKLITSEKDSIIFKRILNGSDTTQSLKIFNNSSAPLNLTSTQNNKSDFTITNTFPINISAKSFVNLSVKFSPSNQTKITDTLFVVTKTNEQMVALPLTLIGNSDLITSVENNIIPKDFILYQNYPNPFNPSTKISYSLPQRSRVVLSIFNVLGEKIATLFDGIKNIGTYQVNWNAKNYSSGLYFYTIEMKSLVGNSYFKKTNKMIFLK